MTHAYIGLGSNLNHPEIQVAKAVRALQDLPDTELLCCSSFYRSKPVGPQDQPDYINATVLLDTKLPANILLHALQDIEKKLGRTRNHQRWGPRIIDLDLLLFGDKKIIEDDLTLPHPEIANRNFVLVPLLEITPELDIPGKGKAKKILERIGNNNLTKLMQHA